jgi:hypothetical protein
MTNAAKGRYDFIECFTDRFGKNRLWGEWVLGRMGFGKGTALAVPQSGLKMRLQPLRETQFAEAVLKTL